ncbi:cytochrome oxidase maturation protein, cbb3-type [Amylibacter ulvae]|uniref:Cytochrome oxidase maturation protein, cbb3-type n=1 Tax=Paramylibacter ulvae TaxID=1651968 RepID=A0ABQ3CVN6_9RHOB|nr:cbb3-type cytochrome oxidase assembly protein CcoS [Amylibacter ulvae]GHA43423.1 cytochrome oxidase maturation protein, cbb3-type [Amylibacter ulvae]
MSVLIYLIPISLFLGGIGLLAFFWAIKTKQFDDPDGNAARILFDDDAPDDEVG